MQARFQILLAFVLKNSIRSFHVDWALRNPNASSVLNLQKDLQFYERITSLSGSNNLTIYS